jgi:hypothetical protein
MLEQVTGLAEMIGAVGVILSLIYVGKQLKQTNAMSRSAARQSLSAQMTDWAMAIAASPTLSESLSKVHFHNLVRDDATDLERVQVAYSFIAIVGQIHLAYEQQKEGILTKEELHNLNGPGGALFRQPYLASLWPVLRPTYPPDFGRWFERRYSLGLSGEQGSART